MSSFGAPGPVEIYSHVQRLQSLYVTVVESRVVLAHTPKINLICLGVWPQSTNVTDSQMDRPTDDLQWHRPDVESRPNREKQQKNENAETYPRLGTIWMYAECTCLRCLTLKWNHVTRCHFDGHPIRNIPASSITYINHVVGKQLVGYQALEVFPPGIVIR